LLVDLVRVSLVSAFIVAGFYGYLRLLGVPMTRARNFYNEAQLVSSVVVKIDLLQKSLAIWPEDYVRDQLAELEAKNR
jgi:hypothetical protein